MISDLAKKLGLKAGQRAIIVNAPPGYLTKLEPLPEKVDMIRQLNGLFDFIQLFAADIEELAGFAPACIDSLKAGAIFWISFPNRNDQTSGDSDWEVIRQAGFRPVYRLAVNENWSALQFKPVNEAPCKGTDSAINKRGE